jgi:hypothetical protein
LRVEWRVVREYQRALAVVRSALNSDVEPVAVFVAVDESCHPAGTEATCAENVAWPEESACTVTAPRYH